MGFIDSVKHAFSHYFDFRIRSPRSAYWWWILFLFLSGIIIIVANLTLFGPTVEQSNSGTVFTYDRGILGSIFELVILIPSLAVTC